MSAPLPAGYAIRPATPADLTAIVEVGAACELADFGEVDLSESWIDDDWHRPRFTLSTDTWLIVGSDGDVAAYALTWDEEPHTVWDAMGFVHPTHRGRGLGAALVAATEARALSVLDRVASGAAPLVHHSFAETAGGAGALFRSLGYHPARVFLHMEIALPAPPVGQAPDRITIRPRRPQDDRAIHLALEESFADHWGAHPETFEQWMGRVAASSNHRPDLWYVACEGSEVVGVMTGAIVNGRGWVEDLGVRERWRRRGIGEALLRVAFDVFWSEGLTTATLNVDSENATGATRLYERAGMRLRRRWHVVGKTLTSAR